MRKGFWRVAKVTPWHVRACQFGILPRTKLSLIKSLDRMLWENSSISIWEKIKNVWIFIQYNLWKTKNIKQMLKSRRWFEHRTLRFFVSTLTNCNRMLYHLAIETTSHAHLLQLNLILNLHLTAYSHPCYRIINGNDAGAWRIISLSHTFMQDTTWSTTYSTHFWARRSC